MATKIVVNYPGSLSAASLDAKKQSVADALGVCPEDVVCLPGLSVSVVDVPDAMTKAREKADRQAAKEQEQAEADAQRRAEEDARAEADAIRKLQQQTPPVRVNLPAGTPESREKEELTEQHSTDVRREVAGEPKPTTTPAGDERNPRAKADAKQDGKTDAGPADYESWTVEDLHAEAARRDLAGRSGLDKAGLVKLIQKADKDDARPKAAPAHAAHGHAHDKK